MPSDGGGFTDDVVVELNGVRVDQPAALARPANSETKERWADYLIGLGIHPDRREELLEGTKVDLQELAGKLGG